MSIIRIQIWFVILLFFSLQKDETLHVKLLYLQGGNVTCDLGLVMPKEKLTCLIFAPNNECHTWLAVQQIASLFWIIQTWQLCIHRTYQLPSTTGDGGMRNMLSFRHIETVSLVTLPLTTQLMWCGRQVSTMRLTMTCPELGLRTLHSFLLALWPPRQCLLSGAARTCFHCGSWAHKTQ